jgi:hypothetical protein
MKRFLCKLLSGFKNSHKHCGPSHRERKVRLCLEALEERRLMAAAIPYVNVGAPIILHVQIEAVYYGSDWSGQASNPALSAELTAEAQDINQFFSTITNSPYLDGLSEYTMTNPNGTRTAPGRGSFAKSDFVPGQLTSGQTISEAVIRTMLSNEIQSGHLDAPNGNTLYMVFMPPGVVEQGDVGSGGGHHSSFAYGGGTAYYATIEHQLTGMTMLGGLNNATNFQYMTEVVSHEMVEAITDPMVNVAGKQAWVSSNPRIGEIGDMTQFNTPPGVTVMGLEGPGVGYAYVVQKYWSNVQNTSVIPGGINFQSIQVLPTLSNMAFTLVDQSGRSFGVTWGNATSISNDGSQATFSGIFDGQGVSVLVRAKNGQKLDVQITTASGGSLFNGIISQPSGRWLNKSGGGDIIAPDYVEMLGTVYKSSQALSAFGTGGAAAQPQFTGAQYSSSYGGMGDGPLGQFNNYNSPNRHRRAYE